MSKITTLEEMVGRFVRDGDTLFVGGFGQNVPFAIAFELIRQRRRGLTLCRTGADILFDLLIAAGAVRKVVVGWIGNPGIGLNHAFSRAWREGRVEIEDSSNFGLLLRLTGGALGIPYIPTRTLSAGDVPGTVLSARPIRCPFTDEPLMALSALTPDAAIVHAQRADADGNLQCWGILGDTIEGVNASTRIIATVEEMVSRSAIRAAPERTVVPGWRVDAVAQVPFGAYPSYVLDYYDRDDEFYRAYDRLARDPDELERWIDAHVRAVTGWEEYLRLVGRERIETLVRSARSNSIGGNVGIS